MSDNRNECYIVKWHWAAWKSWFADNTAGVRPKRQPNFSSSFQLWTWTKNKYKCALSVVNQNTPSTMQPFWCLQALDVMVFPRLSTTCLAMVGSIYWIALFSHFADPPCLDRETDPFWILYRRTDPQDQHCWIPSCQSVVNGNDKDFTELYQGTLISLLGKHAHDRICRIDASTYIHCSLSTWWLDQFCQRKRWVSLWKMERVLFSNKGTYRLFLTGSYDGMTRLWNSSGECVTTFQGHSNAVKSVAFAQGKFKIHYPIWHYNWHCFMKHLNKWLHTLAPLITVFLPGR